MRWLSMIIETTAGVITQAKPDAVLGVGYEGLWHTPCECLLQVAIYYRCALPPLTPLVT
jgi:hypothetical protein